MTNAKHELAIEVEEDAKKCLRERAKRLYAQARNEIENRNKWIKAREDQKNIIEGIAERVPDAYDRVDIGMLNHLDAELRNYNTER